MGALTLVAVGAVFLLPPLPQDPAYHAFADGRTLFGIANFWNVVSNLPFILAGVYGLNRIAHVPHAALRLPFLLLCLGSVLVGLGSAGYHLRPSSTTLVWDRLPMTVTFMAFFSLVLMDRVDERIGRALLWPLIIAGAASVAYWHWTELQQRGDLRAYAVVQFLPMLLIPGLLMASGGRWLPNGWVWGVLGAYVLAKIAEYYDRPLYDWMGFAGGHGLKHTLAAAAVLMAIVAVTGKPAQSGTEGNHR